MEWMIKLPQLLLSLSFLVAVHEMGHLLAAKYFKMRVEQFSIGFPPKLWSFKKGETEYAISAIPLGGYVKISGMIDESLDTEAMKLPPQPWEFRAKPAWQRLIVMLGGIFVNVVVGIIIFIGITYVYGDTYVLKKAVNDNGGFLVGPIGETLGLKTGDKIVAINGKDFEYADDVTKPETLIGASSYTIERDGQRIDIPIPANFIEEFSEKGSSGNFVTFRFAPIVELVAPKTIAEKVGLKKGDRIVEVNGVPITYKDELDREIRNIKTNSIEFKVSRDGNILAFKEAFNTEKPMIGFQAQRPTALFETVTYGLGESIPLGTERAFSMLFTQVKAFGKLITGKLSVNKSLSGPLGIMDAFDAGWDWVRFWSLTGMLSLVLAFMNLLPIPALDGGHVMFLSYEIISRRKPSDKFLETAQKVGMVFLLALMVFIFANDIIKKIPSSKDKTEKSST
ncbi:regulator of sigma E protease [Chryseolinea serpens]|uniref:Zinc metalloprotease n=1 Tax=Chryseolinea serpens TaxID=947013 RepID=A0A1M5UBL4_9BACT|nr:RIP metalloprotease RseP [Chryseolinea serpens]SHH60435.1 regulator of sigma E protease [Chryseolinea serpens]